MLLQIKDDANGASSFTSPSSIDGVTSITVTTESNANWWVYQKQ